MLSAFIAAKQTGCILSGFDCKAANIKKHIKEANDSSTYCDSKPAKTTFNHFVE